MPLFASFLHPFMWYTFSINNRQELVGGKVNEMKKRIAAIVLCALLVVSVFPTATFAAQNNEDIIILYENDVHCSVEGYSKLSAMKRNCRRLIPMWAWFPAATIFREAAWALSRRGSISST